MIEFISQVHVFHQLLYCLFCSSFCFFSASVRYFQAISTFNKTKTFADIIYG